MSDLKVNRIEPSTASTVVVTPSVEIQNTIGSVVFTVKDNHTYVYSPLNVGSEIDNSTGNAYSIGGDPGRVSPSRPVAPQHLTSRGSSLSPEWTVGVPYGGIMLWWGLTSNIPTGWVLCDGTTTIVNGVRWTTPDLRDKFVVGAGGAEYSVGEEGGAASHTHSILIQSTQIPYHSHLVVCKYNYSPNWGVGNYTFDAAKGLRTTMVRGSGTDSQEEGRRNPTGHTTGYWVRVSGPVDSNNNPMSSESVPPQPVVFTTPTLPPFYALCYIMRVPTG